MPTPVPPIVGRRDGPEHKDVLGNFYRCARCGQAVDRRDLGAIFHHLPEHSPMSDEDATRLLNGHDRARLRALLRWTPNLLPEDDIASVEATRRD